VPTGIVTAEMGAQRRLQTLRDRVAAVPGVAATTGRRAMWVDELPDSSSQGLIVGVDPSTWATVDQPAFKGASVDQALRGLAAGGVAVGEAYADDARRGWGIAFPTETERDAYDHSHRMRLARLGGLTPESAAPEEQTWHTYPPVAMPSVEAVVGARTRPETWPDYASEIGRFTPLRPGGLAGQTFEIEVATGTESGRPMFTRGYVTITTLVTPDDPQALRAWVDALEDGLARYGDGEPRAVPEDGEPVVGFDLTTHQGHFMGAGHNRLLLYTVDGQAYVRAAGTWDPMPWHVDQAYRRAGQTAQHAFWGQGDVARLSMLHQLADQVSR